MSSIQNTTLFGSIVSAVLASICCIGPIVFAVLGVGGAGFILQFEEYRPLFIGVAVTLLGGAGFLVYRKKPASECAPGSYCASPRSDRLNRIVFWVAAVVVAISIFIPTIPGWFV